MEERSAPAAGTARRRRWLAALFALCFCIGLFVPAAFAQSAAPAESRRSLVPLGRTVGIKLFSDGLLVVNLSESTDGAGNVSPARPVASARATCSWK